MKLSSLKYLKLRILIEFRVLKFMNLKYFIYSDHGPLYIKSNDPFRCRTTFIISQAMPLPVLELNSCRNLSFLTCLECLYMKESFGRKSV